MDAERRKNSASLDDGPSDTVTSHRAPSDGPSRTTVPGHEDEFDLFLSFSSQDAVVRPFGREIDLVRTVKRALESYRHPEKQRGFRVCTFDDDFELKPDVEEAIRFKIDRSAAVLVLCTPAAGASAYVRMELNHTRLTKTGDRLLAGVVGVAPDQLFPGGFVAGSLAADFTAENLVSRRKWDKRVQIECAKVVAWVWRVRLIDVYDRFVEARRRRLIRLASSFSTLGLLVVVAAGIALHNFTAAEQTRHLATHRRYAADVSFASDAWRAGDVVLAKTVLSRYLPSPGSVDLRSFEWFSQWREATSEVLTMGVYGEPAYALAVAPQGQFAAVSGTDRPVRVFNPVDGRMVTTLSAGTRAARALAFDSASRLVVGGTGVLRVWSEKARAEVVLALPGAREVVDLAMRPRMGEGLAVDNLGQVFFFRLDGGEVRRVLQTRPGRHFRLIYTADGGAAMLGAEDGRIYVIDAVNFGVRRTIRRPDLRLEGTPAATSAAVLFPAGDRIAIVEATAGGVTLTPYMGGIVTTIAVRDDGKLLAVAGNWSGIELWQTPMLLEPRSWRHVGDLKGYRGWPSSARFVAGTTLLVSTTLGGDIKVWDTARVGRTSYAAHTKDVVAAHMLPESGDLVSLDSGGTLRRWGPRTNASIWELHVGDDSVALAIDRAGGIVAVAHDSGTVTLLNMASGATVERRPGFGPIAASQDGRVMAWVGADGESVEVRTRGSPSARSISLEFLKSDPGSVIDIVCLAVSPGGNTIAAGMGSGAVLVIDLKGGKRPEVRQISDRVLWSVAFSPDGGALAVGGIRQPGACPRRCKRFGNLFAVWTLGFGPQPGLQSERTNLGLGRSQRRRQALEHDRVAADDGNGRPSS